MSRRIIRVLATLCLIPLGACSAVDRLKNVGSPPALTPMGQTQKQAEQNRSIHLPMPTPQKVAYQPNSLWQSGARAFFKDQRAAQVGDILTVIVNIDDSASVNNKTSRSRSSNEDSDITNLLGIEGSLSRLLPNQVTPSAVVSLGSAGSSSGDGKVDRDESIALTVAAIVSQVLPNGNLIIQGRQEVRVNFEVRDLLISGIVRPEDISNSNTIDHTQIAEARISYGGRGQITDLQQPRYGQQVFDIIFPF